MIECLRNTLAACNYLFIAINTIKK